ncbi:N-acetylated-alpha-linked acidic dipeptidase 2-like [Glandiceps talaboti]
MAYSLLGGKHPRMRFSVFVIILLIVGMGIGLLLGYLVAFSIHYEPEVTCGAACEDGDERISPTLISSMAAENIRGFLRDVASKPHLAGTEEDLNTAEYIRNTWIEQGLDSATIYPYDVLLSYPDDVNPNKVQILNSDGSVNFTCAEIEETLRPGDEHPNIVKQFNAYSAKKMAQGDLVYVNYARVEDFDTLATVAPALNLTGKLMIARYGKLFRGNKALNAQSHGAEGLILYSDPDDYSSSGLKIYPSGLGLPGSGVQRGNLHASDYKGDPLTPGYPAKESTFRIDVEDTYLPNIPVQPIGYDDALALLRELDGDDAPSSWQGGLDITYKLGPGFTDPDRKVLMDIHTTNERRWTYNTVGFIRGAVEPDRYVIVGNHNDAWVFGAVDPSSGTAAMLEVTRAFGELVSSKDWRPRRSILFCSWGAEEYGLVGSTEWVEEFAQNLGARSIAYLNIDSAVTGDWSMTAKSSPLLRQAIFNAAKKVTDPDDPSRTLYDSWLERIPDYDYTDIPYISNLGSGSDFAPFMYRIGVPGLDIRYRYDSSLGISSNPTYHSAYETLYLMEEFLDPTFSHHLAMSRVMAEITRDLSDSLIIPFNCNDYAVKLNESVDNLKSSYGDAMQSRGITFETIDSAVVNFTASAGALHNEIDTMDTDNALAIRAVNDQLMNIERAFIDPLGLPDRKFLRHIVFAPSSTNSYSSASFPGIVDAMFKIDEDPNEDERWKTVEEQMSVAALTIQSAATTMTDYQL